MRKCDNYFAVSYYRYAPESIRATWNGKPIELTDEERSRLGNTACTRGYKAAINVLKNIVRSFERKEEERVTYGYKYIDDADKFAYTRQVTARPDDINSRLSAYKEIKRYFASRDWTFESYVVTSGTFEPFGKSTKGKTEAIMQRINPEAPVKVHFHPYTIYRA